MNVQQLNHLRELKSSMEKFGGNYDFSLVEKAFEKQFGKK